MTTQTIKKFGNPTLPKCRKCGAVLLDQDQTGELTRRLVAQYKLEGFWFKYPVHSCAIISTHCGVQTFITLAIVRDRDERTYTCAWIGEGFTSEEERKKEFDRVFPPTESDVCVPDGRGIDECGTPLAYIANFRIKSDSIE